MPSNWLIRPITADGDRGLSPSIRCADRKAVDIGLARRSGFAQGQVCTDLIIVGLIPIQQTAQRITWSRQSRRIEPISRSAYSDSQIVEAFAMSVSLAMLQFGRYPGRP